MLIVTSFIPTNTRAQSIPLNGLSLKLVPQHESVAEDVGTKAVQVSYDSRGLKVIWYSLVKNMVEGTEYPTFKIKVRRGIVETDGLELKTALFQPALWGNGYIRTETALPLWVDPEYLKLKGRQKQAFNAGLLGTNKYLLKTAPDRLFEQLTYFQNLYDQYVMGHEVRDDIGLKRSDRSDLREFANEFFLVRRVARTRATLFVNQKKDRYPARIIGNDYFHLVVLDDPLNPLVIRFRVFPEKVPTVFKKIFEQFKRDFEFRITQINY